MDNIAVNTTIPIFLLMGAGLLSRKTGILKSGDERVLSAYVYYFAMPALSLLNLAETEFTAETFRFMLAGILPVFGVLLLYLFSYYAFRLPKHTVYLWSLSSVFGSVAFFGDFLYQKLEEVILPLFYKHRDRFVELMCPTIAINGSFFNTQRMLQQYVLNAYFR